MSIVEQRRDGQSREEQKIEKTEDMRTKKRRAYSKEKNKE
jgi:hypothetical protein